MLRTTVLRVLRMAALAAAVPLTFSGLAQAYDRDDYYYRHEQARQQGYQNGFRDGVAEGRYDRGQGYRYNFKSQQWDDGRGGYERWMGSFGRYKKAYRQGYAEGYSRGFSAYGHGYRNRNGYYRWRGRYDWR